MTDPISRLRELEQAATPEPWQSTRHMFTEGDAQLICALRNSAKEIIELLEAVGALHDASRANMTGLLASPTAEQVIAKEDAQLRLHGAYDSLIAKLESTQ